MPTGQIPRKSRPWPRIEGPCLLLFALGLVPLGGCGGGEKAQMSGNMVIETPEERAAAEADSKREAEEEARAARKGRR